jgi:hypothetical protein
LMHLINMRIMNTKIMIVISIGVLFTIFYTSIHKPNYLWHMIRLTGLDQQGTYPLPINSVIALVNKFFDFLNNFIRSINVT